MKPTTDSSIMTKNAFFFSHDSNARNDEKIIKLRMQHGAEGYGIYFMLIEILLESSSYELSADYISLAFNLHCKEEMVRAVIEDFGLFEFSDDFESFFSPSFNKRMKPLEKIRENRRQAGIKSGEARREKAERKSAQQLEVAEEQMDEQNRTGVEHLLPKNEQRRGE